LNLELDLKLCENLNIILDCLVEHLTKM